MKGENVWRACRRLTRLPRFDVMLNAFVSSCEVLNKKVYPVLPKVLETAHVCCQLLNL